MDKSEQVLPVWLCRNSSSASEAWQHQRSLPWFLMFMFPSFLTREPRNDKPLLRLGSSQSIQTINSLSLMIWAIQSLTKFLQPLDPECQCECGRAALCCTCCEELSGTPQRALAVGYHSSAVQWPETRDSIRRQHDKKRKWNLLFMQV